MLTLLTFHYKYCIPIYASKILVFSLAGSFTYSRYLLIEQNIKKTHNIRRSKESFNVWSSTRKLFQMFQIMNIERNLLNMQKNK